MSSNPSARVTPLTTARPARARRVAGRPTVQHHPEAFEPDESPGYLMHLALHSMQAQIERLMFDHDLTAMQWRPLYILSRGRAATAADLARLMQVDNGAVTRMLDRLEAKGLVARERSTTDRRVVKLLADSGRSPAGPAYSAGHLPHARHPPGRLHAR